LDSINVERLTDGNGLNKVKSALPGLVLANMALRLPETSRQISLGEIPGSPQFFQESAKHLVGPGKLYFRHAAKIPSLDSQTQIGIIEFVRSESELRNSVVRAVLEEFQPRFVPHAQVIWVNEARNRAAVACHRFFRQLGLQLSSRRDFPNILLLDRKRGQLVLIDVPGVRGRISGDRCAVLERVFGDYGLGLVFANAFKSRRELQELLDEPPWGTSAWIADEPKHMIHFNGPEFLGPYKTNDTAPGV
jgi:hypothetical protein